MSGQETPAMETGRCCSRELGHSLPGGFRAAGHWWRALGQDSATRGDRTAGFIMHLLQLIGFFGPVY